MVVNRAVTVVKSAGNEAGSCRSQTGNVTSPGLAYNVITVGNFDDRNTVDWATDGMHPCSSYVDPTSTHGDRQKPEVAAPGTNINSTIISDPWVGCTFAECSGTSFAAPMVTGVAALLMQRNSTLQIWPESVKAILMATAVHNIEGAARLSDKDGAGGIVADRADNVVQGINGGWGTVGYSCNTPTPLDVATMPLVEGVRTRVVIAWNNDPAYQFYDSQPSADLNLVVYHESGSFATAIGNFDNTYEILSFIPWLSGNHILRVVRTRCEYSPARMGWAWYQGN